MSTLFTFLALLASVNSAPTSLSNFIKQDALAAQKLNAQFAAINLSDPCQGSFFLLPLISLALHSPLHQRWPDGLPQLFLRTMPSRSMEFDLLFFSPP